MATLRIRNSPRSIDQYQMRAQQFHVEQVGRYEYTDGNVYSDVNIETWSAQSGEPIPPFLQIPLVDVPQTLPKSLHIDRWHDNLSNRKFCDPPIPRFRVNFPREDKLASNVRRCLVWACREQYSLSNVDAVLNMGFMRDVGKTAKNPKRPWGTTIYIYQGKIFLGAGIKQYNDEEENEGYTYADQNNRKAYEEDGGYYYYTPEAIHSQNSKIYDKKFEDIMAGGGKGDNAFSGVNVTRIVTVGKHRILTTSKVYCQPPDGGTGLFGERDCLENYAEITTQRLVDEDWFNKVESLRLWTLCALGGIPTMYCGHKTDDGQLCEIKKYNMADLKDIGISTNFWHPDEVVSFLDDLLCWVKQNTTEGSTYILSYKRNHVTLCYTDIPKLKKAIGDLYPGETLPQEPTLAREPRRETPRRETPRSETPRRETRWNPTRQPRRGTSQADMSDNWRQ